jgi:hypothetical protein
LIAESDIHMVAKIEVIIYYTFLELFDDFIIFWLVDGPVQKFMFEGDEAYIANAQNFAIV